MCKQCHQRISDDVTTEQLREVLDNPRFEVWNSTSVNHVYLSAAGVNGPEARRIALAILVEFIEWLGTPGREWTFDAPPAAYKVKRMHTALVEKEKTDAEKSLDDIKHEVFSGAYLEQLYAEAYRDDHVEEAKRLSRGRSRCEIL